MQEAKRRKLIEYPINSVNAFASDRLSSNYENNTIESEITYHESSAYGVASEEPYDATKIENSTENDNQPIGSMTDKQKYEYYKRICKGHSFKAPIPLNIFKKIGFRFVSSFDEKDLRHGSRFLTTEELSAIPRKIDKPFCHPGPELKCPLYQWYLADSIIQEINLKSDAFPNFVVRWVGYEDDYNTVEPLAYVKHTAIYKLFTNPDIYTACRSNNTCIRRRTTARGTEALPFKPLPEIARGTEALPFKPLPEIAPTKYIRAVNKLVSELQLEEIAGRYFPEIGFFSHTSVADALEAQHQFIIKKYIPLINELGATLVVDNHYIGTICGNLQAAAQFRPISKWSIKKPLSIKTHINNGLRKASSECVNSNPHYVCFFIPKKYGRKEKKDKKQLSLHMCAYVIRSKDGLKDAIYYNPSLPCNKCDLPSVLDKLNHPIMRSITNKFGVASDKDDCLFKCMSYIIGLATGEAKFEPDYTKPSRKFSRYYVKESL